MDSRERKMAEVMKLFVTGDKGFIGQNLIKGIPSTWKVATFDIKDCVKTRPIHLSDRIKECDWVIHLGALSSTTETNAQKVMDLNLLWSIELFEECLKYNVNFQWASSASVYGIRSDYKPLKETDPCKPANLYALSKYLFEQYVRYRNVNIIYQGFRYFNVYGNYEDHKGSQASPYTQFTKQALDTGVINVFEGSETFFRDFVPVEQVVSTHIKMMSASKSGIFNVGTGNPKSFLSVAENIAKKYGASINTIPFPDFLKNHYQEYTCADVSYLEQILQQ